MNDLLNQAETDLTWSLSNLTEFNVSLGKKRAKWLRLLLSAIKVKDNFEEEMKAKQADLTVYYMKDYNLAIDRRDVEHYVNADKEYQECIKKFNSAKRNVTFIEKVLSALEKISYETGNVVKYEIFKAGG